MKFINTIFSKAEKTQVPQKPTASETEMILFLALFRLINTSIQELFPYLNEEQHRDALHQALNFHFTKEAYQLSELDAETKEQITGHIQSLQRYYLETKASNN